MKRPLEINSNNKADGRAGQPGFLFRWTMEVEHEKNKSADIWSRHCEPGYRDEHRHEPKRCRDAQHKAATERCGRRCPDASRNAHHAARTEKKRPRPIERLRGYRCNAFFSGI